ncbi:hypothetical protein Rhsp01_27740 [Rhizobium sp. NBRC 114257]|nr:hypothetical protein Rhsp01_27740 [Rhizobium sp. NBRC 114257]
MSTSFPAQLAASRVTGGWSRKLKRRLAVAQQMPSRVAVSHYRLFEAASKLGGTKPNADPNLTFADKTSKPIHSFKQKTE